MGRVNELVIVVSENLGLPPDDPAVKAAVEQILADQRPGELTTVESGPVLPTVSHYCEIGAHHKCKGCDCPCHSGQL